MSLHLMNRLKIEAIKWIYPRLLSKCCGKLIPMSGEAGKKVNCYSISIFNEDGKQAHLIDKIDKEKGDVYVLSLDDKGVYSVPKTLNLDILCSNKIKVHHFYKQHKRVYSNLPRLIFDYVTKYEIMKVNFRLLRNFFLQAKFNRKNLVSHKRIKLLQIVLNKQLDQSQLLSNHQTQTGVNIWDLMNEIHSIGWVNHPDGDRKQRELQLHLESLVNSGDLKKDINAYDYILTNKALQTIQEYETEEDRHNDSISVQRKIVILTFSMVIVGLIQAFASFCKP